ncbi:TPA: hypothetical protein JFP82_002174 [Vibrio cholerae O1]|uniref:hypothetical protein n=1 Tax=Vibrio cholerae TaxID=666 RepID=UPI0004E46848|nr:hypothetical protein [Vibrio cholerae]HAU9839370.1 hypothetical protein [Vibrio cholerae O1]KFE28955.1 hypothetical protein DN30_336 [Vibrio cholerae]TXY43998.1 hypothetical protein FXE84_01280 [Vibrio cholerae]HBN6882461.1 hypothetical protein [Vibrio cholerae]HBN6885687.1 hypothetical protein [Vibrio cholerae]
METNKSRYEEKLLLIMDIRDKCFYGLLILLFFALIGLPFTGFGKNKQASIKELSNYTILFEQCLTRSNGNKLQCLSYLKATTSDATYDAILSKLTDGNATEDKPIGF